MGPNIHLIIHNVICIISSVVMVALAFFTYLNGPKNRMNQTFTLLWIAVLVFVVSHVIGVSVIDPVLSRNILMLNLSVLFIAVFSVHSTYIFVNREKEGAWVIAAFYISAVLITVFFLIYPDLFLLPSVPKMYFPNYYNPGMLNWVRVAYLYGLAVPYTIFLIAKARAQTTKDVERSQYTYMLIAFSTGYLIGFLPNLLVYNIQFDPAIGMAFVMIYAVPLVYGAVRFGLLNVKVIAQQAFFYAISVAVVGGLITLFNYSNFLIVDILPDFPIWIISLMSAILVVSASVLIWRHLRQTDILKYEFMTTVTHKFRTPLTHIKWATENMALAKTDDDRREQIGYIQDANSKLVELTDLLTNASEVNSEYYRYRLEETDISALTEEVLSSLKSNIASRKLTANKFIEPGLICLCDQDRIKFVVQTLIENAINYTGPGGAISVLVRKDGDSIMVSVADSGIGISKEELPMLFSEFYRSKEARTMDTEGMGIGLTLAERILERHDSKIRVASEGLGKGSTFSFRLQMVNEPAARL